MYEPTQEEMDYLLKQARYRAEKLSIRFGKDIDDLMSAAHLGITLACHAWGKSRRASFKTYAKIRMEGEMKEDLRCNTFFKGRVNFPSVLHGLDFDRMPTEEDIMEGIEASEIKTQITEHVNTSPTFTGRERQVYHLLHIEGLNQKEISEKWGVTQSCVSLHKTSLYKKLREWGANFYDEDDG